MTLRLATIASVCALTLWISTTWAQADTLLVEDFESSTLDSWPTSWTPDGNASSEPAKNKVTADPLDATNKVLKLESAETDCWGALAYRAVDFPAQFTLSFDVYNGTDGYGNCHPHRAKIGMRQGTSWSNPARYLMIFYENGNVGAWDPVEGDIPALTTYDLGKWYHVDIDYIRDGDSLVLRYDLDGTFLGKETHTLTSLVNELSLDHFEFTAGDGSAYIDNIEISTLQVVPLPQALPVGALGILGVMVFRRRLRRASR